jgi:hypothetical protein
MMTWGTWYVLWSTWTAAASDLRSWMGVSDSSLWGGVSHPSAYVVVVVFVVFKHLLCFKLVGEDQIGLTQHSLVFWDLVLGDV